MSCRQIEEACCSSQLVEAGLTVLVRAQEGNAATLLRNSNSRNCSRLTARMIETAFMADELALETLQESSAIDAVLPVVVLASRTELRIERLAF